MPERFIRTTESVSVAVSSKDPGAFPRRVRYTTLELIAHFITHDRRFNANGRGYRASGRIENNLLERKPGDPSPFRVQEDDWKLLCEAAEDPLPMGGASEYPIMPARRIEHLLRDITEAPHKDPGEAVRPAPGAQSSPRVESKAARRKGRKRR